LSTTLTIPKSTVNEHFKHFDNERKRPIQDPHQLTIAQEKEQV